MGFSCKLIVPHKYSGINGSLAPISQLAMNCCRTGNSRAPSMSFPRMLAAVKLEKVSVFPSSFSSDFFSNAGLLQLKLAAMEVKGGSVHGGALASTCSISVSPNTLTWIFTGAAAGEYGLWAAFLALLVRLFYYIPGELELPLTLVLLVITAPYQAMDLRGTTGALVACAGIAAFLAYQHFSGAGGLRGSFKEGTFVASLAVICLVGVPFAFLFRGF